MADKLTRSCADSLEVWEPQSCGNFNVCPGLYKDFCALPCFKNNCRTSLIGDVFIPFDRYNIELRNNLYLQSGRQLV
jgi:hypothetical protein